MLFPLPSALTEVDTMHDEVQISKELLPGKLHYIEMQIVWFFFSLNLCFSSNFPGLILLPLTLFSICDFVCSCLKLHKSIDLEVKVHL